MPMNQPTDTDTWDRIDEHRSAHLDDVGAPGYDAVVVVTTSGEERLALARRDAINCAGRPYWACRLASGRPARADPPVCPSPTPRPVDAPPPSNT